GRGRLMFVWKTVARACGGLVDQRLSGRELDRHVREHPLDSLKLRDGSAELTAFPGIVERKLVRAFCDSKRDRRGAHALSVIGVHEAAESLPDALGRKHNHVFGNIQVIEDDFRFREAAHAHGRLALPYDQAFWL